MVSNERTCAVVEAAVEEVRLFTNLFPNVRPMATKPGTLPMTIEYSCRKVLISC